MQINIQEINTLNTQPTILPHINSNKLPQTQISFNFLHFLIELTTYPFITLLRISTAIINFVTFLIKSLQKSYKNLRFILFARSRSRKIAALNIAILHAILLIFTYMLINKLYKSAQNINYLVNTKHPPLLISQADGYLKQDIEIDVLGQANLLITQTQQIQKQVLNTPFIYYKVAPGDTIYTIAVRYGISTNTLIAANKIKNPNYLKIGQTLKVPLQDGILYTVKKGDTLASIAKKYKISTASLAKANNLKTNSKINSGKLLLIPGVKPKTTTYYAKKTTTKTTTSKDKYLSGSYFTSTGGSCSFALKYVGYGLQNYKVKPAIKYVHFIRYNPIAGRFRLGSGFAGYRWGTYYWHSGVDYVAAYGTPIIAVADGIVNRTGYQYGGYGYYVKIYHPQVGLYTLYGHMSRFHPSIKAGTKVKAGQVIGYVGTTGLAYGAHLHFEVIDRNRLRYNPACFK